MGGPSQNEPTNPALRPPFAIKLLTQCEASTFRSFFRAHSGDVGCVGDVTGVEWSGFFHRHRHASIIYDLSFVTFLLFIKPLQSSQRI